MKIIACLIIMCFSFFVFGEIDDSSFKNADKYNFLKQSSIGMVDSINLDIKFIPPKGKKVNKASFVKIWEKEKGKWIVSQQIEISEAVEEWADNELVSNVLLNSKNSEAAIEVEFIHCNLSGGQCAMERYLGRFSRDKKQTNNKLKFELKIKK
jgi:hypothetical protein